MNLNEEDRIWIATTIRTEFKQSELRTAEVFDHKLKQTAEAFDQKLHESEIRTAEALERLETKLLTAFHQWASPIEIRVRAQALALRAFDQETENSIDRERRMAELEARVRKLEKAS